MNTGAVGFAVDLTCERTGASHHKIQIDLPVSAPQQVRVGITSPRIKQF